MRSFLKNLLKITLFVDFLITFGFGVFSWLNPHGTFGTIIAIPSSEEPLVLAILASLSIFYVLLSLVCLIGVFAKIPVNMWIGSVMIIRHAWIGMMGIKDMNKEWLIGDPYPDMIIHFLFMSVYIFAILYLIWLKRG